MTVITRQPLILNTLPSPEKVVVVGGGCWQRGGGGGGCKERRNKSTAAETGGVWMILFSHGVRKMPTDDTKKKFLFGFVSSVEGKKPEMALKEVTRFHFPTLKPLQTQITWFLFSFCFDRSSARLSNSGAAQTAVIVFCIDILQHRSIRQELRQSEGSVSMQMLDHPAGNNGFKCWHFSTRAFLDWNSRNNSGAGRTPRAD